LGTNALIPTDQDGIFSKITVGDQQPLGYPAVVVVSKKVTTEKSKKTQKNQTLTSCLTHQIIISLNEALDFFKNYLRDKVLLENL